LISIKGTPWIRRLRRVRNRRRKRKIIIEKRKKVGFEAIEKTKYQVMRE